MNEFVEQFLQEARELVEQATDDLLALEEKPQDKDRLDSAFRAFHTLKGAAGIVEFPAMERALHAAEDVLAGVRAGVDPVTPPLIGNCLTCLDQVVQWLDAMEGDGTPPADADAGADAIVRRFSPGEPAAAPAAPAREPEGDWLPDLLTRHPRAAAEARVALRYAPEPDCFFRGEDPLARMADLPGLLALDIAPAGAWPALSELDPFTCRLVLFALLSVPPEEAADLVTALPGKVALEPVRPAVPADAASASLSPEARGILEEQIQLLREGSRDGAAGRLASVGRVARNVLRHAGRIEEAGEFDKVLARSLEAGEPDPLVAALRDVLHGSLDIAPEGAAQPLPGAQETVARALRVDVERIDDLVRLTGELTVVKNAIGHAAGLARDGADAKLLAAALRDHHALLDRLVAELQQSVLAIRVLPLRHVFQRFPRLVREMSAQLGKSVRLATEGEETEADKAIVETLFEPLLHAVRNALDHGIERAEERTAQGKAPVATLRLRAVRAGEHVLIEVEDDGRGIDVARVRTVAAERGIAPAETLAALTNEEVVDLIFAPGFSTAAQVTGLSGRGVGMDAVRAAVERMGGRVTVATRPREGTTVRFTLPFTVMMTRVMTVEAGGQVFGIPLDAVVETVRVARERIVPVGAARAFVLRDRTLPLIDLAQALGQARDEPAPAATNVVVATAGGQVGGLAVERLGERMDVMLKPVEGLLAGLRGIAGTTLLGDGRVLIVLDLQELLD